MPLLTGLAMTASFAAIASYLLVSQAWIWRVSAKRRIGLAHEAAFFLHGMLYPRAIQDVHHRCRSRPAALHDRFADHAVRASSSWLV
jgi:hypothetical protein